MLSAHVMPWILCLTLAEATPLQHAPHRKSTVALYQRRIYPYKVEGLCRRQTASSEHFSDNTPAPFPCDGTGQSCTMSEVFIRTHLRNSYWIIGVSFRKRIVMKVINTSVEWQTFLSSLGQLTSPSLVFLSMQTTFF